MGTVSLVALPDDRIWLYVVIPLPASVHSQCLWIYIYVIYIKCAHAKAVLRGEIINSKATLDLKPLSAQCMSNLVRWKFQSVKWCKLEQDIKQHNSYVKCFHILEVTLHNPLSFVICKQKQQSQGHPSQNTPAITHLLWQIKKLIMWSDISNTK